MIGERFGLLVVIGKPPRGQGRGKVIVRCDCGVEKTVRTGDMRKPHAPTRSCGCYARQRIAAANFKHGAAQGGHVTTEWVTWRSMHQRCADPNHKSFPDYGGRGITVCPEWASFEQFRADMGAKPAGLQLERVNNDLGYSKANCVWATRSEQARNRRARARLTNGTFAPGVSHAG